jgi:hypothetical protein
MSAPGWGKAWRSLWRCLSTPARPRAARSATWKLMPGSMQGVPKAVVFFHHVVMKASSKEESSSASGVLALGGHLAVQFRFNDESA